MTDTIILHHYDASPFSQKVRAFLGLKRAAWASVLTPNMMPKDDLTALTGGYRRAPVMQIGADIYCDSQIILAELERRLPDPPALTGQGWMINLWADRLFFQATVAIIFGRLGDRVDPTFIKDREKLSGRPFDTRAMAAAAGPMQGQWRASAAWIETALADFDTSFLAGEAPTLADVAAHMNLWFLASAFPKLADELLAGFERVAAWRARVGALEAQGSRTEITSAKALEIARVAEPTAAPAHDPHDPSGLAQGASVVVMADDYGRDPIAGELVAANAERVTIARDAGELGRLHLHVPRVGYILAPAQR